MRRKSHRRHKRGGGLCAWLGRKHHWSHAKVAKCQAKAHRRHRRHRYTRKGLFD